MLYYLTLKKYIYKTLQYTKSYPNKILIFVKLDYILSTCKNIVYFSPHIELNVNLHTIYYPLGYM
jgi:hypothetical protein